MTMLNLSSETLRNGVGYLTGFQGGGSVSLETLPQSQPQPRSGVPEYTPLPRLPL